MPEDHVFPEFYDSIGDGLLERKFHNLDNSNLVNDAFEHLHNPRARNFVLDFNDESAWAAFDLTVNDVDQLLRAGGPPGFNGRWINVWKPHNNLSLLETIARRYDFSPRLLGLMASDPTACRRPSTLMPVAPQRSRSTLWRRQRVQELSDLDTSSSLKAPSESSLVTFRSSSSTEGNLYRLVHDLWHYHSLDFGRAYTCLGYNSLYPIDSAPARGTSECLAGCIRVWTWLILCEDNTIITINEDSLPTAVGRLDSSQLRTLHETRRNIVNVFRSLSLAPPSPLSVANPMTLYPIRVRLGQTAEETAHRGSDAPGLLLYYVFENWHNSYELIPRRESQYAAELAVIRSDMLAVPRLEHIDRLDRISRDLGVLKRHYESQSRLILRLIEAQRSTAVSTDHLPRFGDDDDERHLPPARHGVGVAISSAAIARFQRLRDLLDLYALSEIDELLKQKDALVAMNFSLIAIKESLDVEKLTRITLLLTKATFLFLPVSFMTTYFSVQLHNVVYTVREYWYAFAVISFLSWIAMFVFGVLSGDASTAVATRLFWRGAARCRRPFSRVRA